MPQGQDFRETLLDTKWDEEEDMGTTRSPIEWIVKNYSSPNMGLFSGMP